MSSIKDEEMSKNSSHEEPDLENQLSQENTNAPNNEDNNEDNNIIHKVNCLFFNIY